MWLKAGTFYGVLLFDPGNWEIKKKYDTNIMVLICSGFTFLNTRVCEPLLRCKL